MGVTPKSHAVYAYDLRSSQPPFVEVRAAGTMDIDQLVLDLKQFALTLESKRVDGETQFLQSFSGSSMSLE